MIKTLKQTVKKSVTSNPWEGEVTVLTCSFENAKDAQKVGILFNKGSVTVDWGDNTSDTAISSYQTDYPNLKHEYDADFIKEHKNKTFNIIIDGDIIRFIGPTARNKIERETPRGIRTLIVGLSPLSKKQTNALCLFENCVNLKSIPNNLFSYCLLKEFRNCFKNTGLVSVPRDLFNTVSEQSDFQCAFQNCHNLQSSDLEFRGSNSHTQRDFYNLFAGCTNLKNVNPDMFKRVSNQATLSRCFANCQNLNIPETLLDAVPNSDISWMFQNVLTTSNINDVPKKLLSAFDESYLNKFGEYQGPFAIDDYDTSVEVIDAVKKNNVMMKVGSKEVGLEDLIGRPIQSVLRVNQK